MKQDKTLDDLFEIIEEHEIYLFAKSFAYTNETFAASLKKQFNKKLPSKEKVPTMAEMTKAIDRCFSNYIKQPTYSRYRSWEPDLLDWDDVSCDIRQINRQLEMLAENGNAELAVDAALLLLEKGGENYDQEWEYDVEVDYEDLHADDTFNVIRNAFETDKISDKKKLDVCKELEQLAHYSAFDNIDISAIIEDTREKLLSDDDRIALRRNEFEKANEGYARESTAEDLWDYLIKLGRDKEAVAFFEGNSQLHRLRDKYIDWLIDHGRLTDALKVIDNGLVVHKEYDGIIYDLECRKLALFEQMNDKPSTIKQAKKLFLDDNSETMKYYHKLKQLIDPAEWPNELRSLINRKNFGKSAVSNLAEIYEEEKWFDDLFLLMKEAQFDLLSGLSSYAKHFDTAQQQILVHRLEPVFCDMARNPMPRKYYKELAAKLRTLRTSCPPGAELVRKLVAEYRTKYKNRPAMLDELKVF